MHKEFNAEEASIEDVVTAVRAGTVTCERVVQAHLQRIGALDKQGPSINAMISISGNALDEARRLDERSSTDGIVGPLHGVPIVLKDNFDVENMPTTAGSPALQAHVARRDAFVVGKLRRAGAIVLGKANLHEFAMGGTTVSSLGGQTRNPYDLTRTPGGSSGGTGAAVAASFCVAGLGSDTVNSIRSPASAQNLVGMRPTRGLLSRTGVVPVSPTQDAVGPLTRSVRDAATMLDCMVGYDSQDSATAWSDLRARGNYTEMLGRRDLKGVRIGVWKDLFGEEIEHREVTRIVTDAAGVLTRAGVILVPIHRAIDVVGLGRDLDVQRLEFKLAINQYLKGAAIGAEIRDLTALIESRKFHPGLEEFLAGANAIDLAADTERYNARLAGMAQLRNAIMSTMADFGLDVLAYPLQRRLVVPIGAPGQPDRNGIVAALTGFPAINIPAGFSASSTSAPLGVPVGMDLLGRPWSEQLLLDIAFALENLAQLRKPPRSTQLA